MNIITELEKHLSVKGKVTISEAVHLSQKDNYECVKQQLYAEFMGWV
ncbi:hypothetical protein HOI26_01615 [Candidatus Woesearchaeota archaeon]|jgi:hypothetical protein|nr:hypothetical protein [Candidatus Woesearchaeota archaeon]MBT5739773.1 hypothetical protein [Candidatus Woesearchaeota archaeon]